MEKEKSNLMKAAGMLAIIVSVFFVIKIVSEIKGFRFIGGGAPAGNTISFSGEGEVFAAPDIALVNLTVREEAKAVKDAQDKVVAKEKSVLDFLAEQGIEKKDIKTESYNSYPKYDYGTPCYGGYCPNQTPKIIGYEVSEYISVKVRDLTKAGEIVGGLGALSVGEISGPNFSIENEDELTEEARKMAIEDAKAKAESLAEDLGVRLVRIVNFTEDGNYPGLMYNFAQDEKAMDGGAVAAPSPELPMGENKIISNVTITYEIR
ncbi:MAG: SIMPL domain-containing protein [bacterium]|nr:SIMPL domain-containing protein [bacterium]